MRKFIKMVSNAKKKIVLICIMILLIAVTIYQFKLIGIAAEADADCFEKATETNAQELEEIAQNEESLEISKNSETDLKQAIDCLESTQESEAQIIFSDDISSQEAETGAENEIKAGTETESKTETKNEVQNEVEDTIVSSTEENIIEENLDVANAETAGDKQTFAEEINTEAIPENKSDIADVTKDEADSLAQEKENEEQVAIPTELSFEGEDYIVKVLAVTDGALKDIKNVIVTPITTETNAKEYNDIYAKLNEKIKSESVDSAKKLAGFLAYDIKLIDNFGNEKEPDGNVNVSIEYKELPDIAVQNSDLEVSVLHFVDTKNLENITQYSQKEENLTIEKDDENQIKKLEFETDSFSTFTITWIKDDVELVHLTVHYIDSNGNEFQGNIEDTINVTLNNIIDLGSYVGTMYPYIYKDTRYNSYDGDIITSIGFENNDTQNENVNVNLYNGTQIFKTFEFNKAYQDAIDIFLVYYKFNKLEIENIIEDKGILKAVFLDENGNVLKDENENEISFQNDNYNLVWYKCDTKNGTYTEDSRVLIGNSSELYNISSDRTELNVALDKGARKYYRVELQDSNKNCLLKTSSVLVEYYDNVQNGGFENPNITLAQNEYTYTWGGYKNLVSYTWGSNSSGLIRQRENGTEGLIWKTTGEDGRIELARAGTTSNSSLDGYYHTTEIPQGKQFAELNAESPGALYQDVLTAPGDVLNWSLYHRGRNGYDTMYVVAMPTKYAESITSYDGYTDENNEYHIGVKDIIDNQADYPGTYCVKITDGNDAWVQHYGEFIIPENQYLTRFFFVAGATGQSSADDTSSTQSLSEGNLIDDIVLSQTIERTPQKNETILTIKKIIRNVPYSLKEVQNTSVNILLTDGDSASKILNENDQSITTFAYNQEEGYWFAIKTISLKDVNSSSIKITESNVSQNFGKYSFSEAKYTLVNNSTQVITGGNLIGEAKGNLNSDLDIELKTENSYTLTIENTYEENTTTLVINKVNIFGTNLFGSSFKIYEATIQNDEEALALVLPVTDESDGKKDGKINFENLKYDTEYIIEEVSSPNDNYYLLENPIHIKITFDEGVTILNSNDFKEGYVTKMQDSLNEINVVNIQHVTMPKAGGIGNYLIYIFGIFIMVSTIILYKKSLNNLENRF